MNLYLLFSWFGTIKNISGAGEMVQQLRALTALPKVVSSNPSNHMMAGSQASVYPQCIYIHKINQINFLKKEREQWHKAGGRIQLIGCVPSIYKTLGSVPSTKGVAGMTTLKAMSAPQ